MIIIKLQGGLGNQLFQYAFGRHLAKIRHTELKLDTASFKNDPNKRIYDLGYFNIVENFATEKDIARFQKFQRKPSRKWFLHNMFIADGRKYVKETAFHFNPVILQTGSDAYLDGFWQTEKYFKDSEEIIHKEITVKTPLSGRDKDVADVIRATNSVMVHIRRGDYVSNQATNVYHGTCGTEYYEKAVDRMAKEIGNLHAFVFSDDHEWVKKNMKLNHSITYVDHNGSDKNYEDLRLMSLCKHHIIANSSFSWWGAWLSNNPNKIVIGPKKWFNAPNKKNAITEDILPKSWIKV